MPRNSNRSPRKSAPPFKYAKSGLATSRKSAFGWDRTQKLGRQRVPQRAANDWYTFCFSQNLCEQGVMLAAADAATLWIYTDLIRSYAGPVASLVPVTHTQAASGFCYGPLKTDPDIRETSFAAVFARHSPSINSARRCGNAPATLQVALSTFLAYCDTGLNFSGHPKRWASAAAR